jgi:hypothetical protein
MLNDGSFSKDLFYPGDREVMSPAAEAWGIQVDVGAWKYQPK